MTKRHYIRTSVDSRLKKKCIPGPNGCVLWTGPISNSGYGLLATNEPRHKGPGLRTVLAHRWVYQQQHGPIPEGMCVCHRCDVKTCVNPDHLFLGTQRENLQDMVQKGRSCASVRHGRWLNITEEQRQDIIALSNKGSSQRWIAAMLDLSQHTVGRILRHER